MKNSHIIYLCSDLWYRGFIETWNTKPHTEHLRRSQATPASSNLLHQYFQPLPFLTAHHLPSIYSWCVFYIWPAACFTIKSQTSTIWSLESTSTKPSTDLSSITWQPSCLSPSCPPSITGILECLASIWQFWRLAEQHCPQEYHRRLSAFSQCQTKPAVFLTALWESQVLSTLHKWTKIAENSRLPATKLQSSSEKRVVIPPICRVFEMRMCENSHMQLTARLEFF